MTDGDALLTAILAEPDEDTPRLMFADWLDEEGRGETAEFIRTQIELARTSERDVVPWNPKLVALRATEKRILGMRFAEWIAPLRSPAGPLEGKGTDVQFRRGFIEVAWMTAAWFVEYADALFRRVPLRELRVRWATPTSFAELLASPHLARLDTLDISGRGLGDAGVTQLVQSRAPAKLRCLRARACGISDGGALRLADFDYDWEPREIDVSLNAIGPVGLAALRDRYGSGVVRFAER